MKSLKIILASISIFLSSCGGEAAERKTPAELRAELKRQEILNPVAYLEQKSVTMKTQRKKVRNAGIFRDAEYADDGVLIQGSIINTATLAKYKDVTVKVMFYSQTETLIDENSYVLYEYFEPNSTKPFSLKVDSPKDFKTFGFQVTGAKAVYD